MTHEPSDNLIKRNRASTKMLVAKNNGLINFKNDFVSKRSHQTEPNNGFATNLGSSQLPVLLMKSTAKA